MDNLTEEQRLKNMRAIQSKDTFPELLVRKTLHAAGYRYSLHKKTLPGKPDLFLRKHNLIIFIHGCFWHQHEGCKFAASPKSNQDYWVKKLQNNVNRDKRNKEKLIKMGFKVLILWECDIKSKYSKNPDLLISKVNEIINQ